VGKLPKTLCSQLRQAQRLLAGSSSSSSFLALLLLLPLLLLPLGSLLSNPYDRVLGLLLLSVLPCLLLLVLYLLLLLYNAT
jgi:hypothetical protein